MKRIALLLVLSWSWLVQAAEIVDCTANTVIGKPDLKSLYGITPAVVLYHGVLFPECRHHPDGGHDYGDWLDEQGVTEFVKSHPKGTTFILNLEGPPCDAWGKHPFQWYTHRPGSLQLVPENLDRLIRAVRFCRAIEAENRWSVYGHTPHWGWGDWKNPRWRRMVRECKPLVDELDFCCPYFYLSAESIVDPSHKRKSHWWLEHSTEEWLYAMRMVLDSCQAAYPETPVYAWIWPSYHRPHWAWRRHRDEDTGEYPYRLQVQRLMPLDVWQRVVETSWKHADGIAVWGLAGSAPEYRIEWDESWPWWNVIRGYALKTKRD